jgi:LacI family transcriptional regulator
MIEHGVSGFIISPAYGDEAATFGPLERAGIPAMQVLRKVSPQTDLFPFAAPDYVAGGRLATEHLIATGARRIAFAGGIEGRAVTAERVSGYLAVMAEHGLPPRVLPGRPTRAFGRECADRCIDAADCDAAVCFNDLVALGMISGFAGRGRLVGRDFRLVGFDDIEEAAQSYPPLSSVQCGFAGFGRDMARTLMAWLSEGQKPPPETRSPVQLVVRGSSAP